MIPIPDHPIGERFCRKCALFLPLANFFKGKRRRYECKAHSRGRQRRKAPAKKRRLPSSEQAPKTSSPQRNKAVAQVWHATYTDCRSSFGQATVGMSQGELRELFEAMGVAEPSTAFRLVPIDPCRALATGNARLVRREVRIRALKAWWAAKKRCGGGEQDEQEGGAGIDARDAYMAALDERGPDEGAVEGPGLVMSVDEAENERQQHDEGEAEKEELDDDTNDEDGEDEEEDDKAKTATATEAATAVAMTATGTAVCDRSLSKWLADLICPIVCPSRACHPKMTLQKTRLQTRHAHRHTHCPPGAN